MEGVHPDLPAGVCFPEFEHLDVMLEDLHLLPVGHFVEQVPDPGPGRKERRRRGGLGIERVSTLGYPTYTLRGQE